MASKDKFPAKHGKTEPQDKKQEHRHFKKTGSSDITNPQVFKKINPSELPVWRCVGLKGPVDRKGVLGKVLA
jgi:hypothetical protein